jgi:hypothetical protein
MAEDQKDPIAMQLARDGAAVSLLANQVVDKARDTVFTELRGFGAAFAAVIGVLGFTTWASIGPKVDAAVSKAIGEEVKTRNEDLKKARDEWFKGIIAVSVEAKDAQRQLEAARKMTETINKESEMTLAKIKKELFNVETESKKTQTYFVTLRSGPPTEENSVEVVFGKLPPKFFAISGTTGKSFGMGMDTPEGGVFTIAFDQACADKATDTDGDGQISMKEIANAIRNKASVRLEPAFGGDDVALFAMNESAPKPDRNVHVLLVGLSSVDAAAYNGWNLRLAGPEKDIERITGRLNDAKRLLASQVSIHTLRTEGARANQIIAKIRELKNDIEEGDIVLMHFSGHCSRRPDASSESSDRQIKQLGAYDGLIDVPAVVRELSQLGAAHTIMIVDG